MPLPTRQNYTNGIRKDTPMRNEQPALTTDDVARLAGMKLQTLHSWVKSGRVVPSIAGPRGRRQPLLWSIRDAVEVRTLADLRRAGVSGQRLRKVQEALARQGESFASCRLLVADDAVHLVHPDGTAEALAQPGQTVLPEAEVTEAATTLLVVRLDRLHNEAGALARPANEVLHHDLQRRGRRAG